MPQKAKNVDIIRSADPTYLDRELPTLQFVIISFLLSGYAI